MRWPKRIYKRRAPWHWLADAGAPDWLWALFLVATWRRCEWCGLRGVGKWKPSTSYGGGLPPRHFCSLDHFGRYCQQNKVWC
jgi:hypothetical protein